MRLFCLFVLLAGFVSSPRAASVTPFERGHDEVVLAVRLNGRGPFNFLLDTGSTHTAVSAPTAAAIGAPVVAKASMGSAAGSRETLVVQIDAMEVGPIAIPNLLASIVELDDGLDGVIGHDALGSLRYTIDFKQRQIEWWPIDQPSARGNELDMQASHGRFLLSLPQQESMLRLVPDTGASSLVLFSPDRKLDIRRTARTATLKTTSAQTEVRVAQVPELRLGKVTLTNVPAVVVERDRSEPDDVDGLLPLHWFERVTVDGPNRRLIVEKHRANTHVMFF